MTSIPQVLMNLTWLFVWVSSSESFKLALVFLMFTTILETFLSVERQDSLASRVNEFWILLVYFLFLIHFVFVCQKKKILCSLDWPWEVLIYLFSWTKKSAIFLNKGKSTFIYFVLFLFFFPLHPFISFVSYFPLSCMTAVYYLSKCSRDWLHYKRITKLTIYLHCLFLREIRNVSVVTSTGYVRAGRPNVWSSSPGTSIFFFPYPRRLRRFWGPSSLLSNGHRGLFPGDKSSRSWGWPLTFN